jgi:hypothetical protein
MRRHRGAQRSIFAQLGLMHAIERVLPVHAHSIAAGM